MNKETQAANEEFEAERARLTAEFLAEDVEAPEGFYWDDKGELQEIVEEIEYKYVLGLDPGGTTGVAMLRYTDDSAPELIYLHQIAEGKEGFLDFFEGSGISPDLTIVSENFTIREGVHGADVTPLYIEGVQYALWRDEVVYQEPMMKTLVSDEWLHEQNLWTPGKRHQMDALIHAIVYLRNNDHRPTQKSLSGDEEKPLAEEGEAEKKQLKDPEGDPGAPDDDDDLDELIEAMRQAMKEAAEAAEGEAAEEVEAEGEGVGDGTDEGKTEASGSSEDSSGGNSSNGEEGNGHGIINPEPKGTRKRKEKNGVFAGFETETDDIETELFSD